MSKNCATVRHGTLQVKWLKCKESKELEFATANSWHAVTCYAFVGARHSPRIPLPAKPILDLSHQKNFAKFQFATSNPMAAKSQTTNRTNSVTKPNTRQQRLGPAPTDIDQLDAEIQHLRSEEENCKPQNVVVYCDDLKEAQSALQQGHTVRYQISVNHTPLQIVAMAQSLGLPTLKLRKALSSSSVITEIVHNYVQNVARKQQHYDGYLKHCTQVTALQCDDELRARFRIKMDLDFHTHYTQDAEFEAKFKREICERVLKCPALMSDHADKLQIIEVREGSIIASIGFFVAFLAFMGVVRLRIYLGRRRRERLAANAEAVRADENEPNANDHGERVEEQEFQAEQGVIVEKNKRGKWRQYNAMVVTPLKLDKQNKRKVVVRYNKDSNPNWFGNEEEFSLTDSRVIALEPGQDPTLTGSVQIGPQMQYIEAKKVKAFRI